MTNFSGALTGHSNELNDPNNQILWQSSNTCQGMQNVGTGLWSSSANWNTGFIPTACNAVTIIAGSTVTLDIPTATASTTTINGTLKFNRSGDNEFTMVGGSMSVNAGGTLDMGTQASSIQQGATAYLILAYGQTAGQYGLVINNGGNFLVYGAAKTPWSFYASGSDITSGTGNITVASAAGWQQGDALAIDTETVTINGTVSGNSVPITHPTLTHSAAVPIVVADLTHNVVVRSSGTDFGTVSDPGNTAYIRSLAAGANSLTVSYGAFAYLGNNSNGSDCPTNRDCGFTFDGASGGASVTGSVSSSTVRDSFAGLFIDGATNVALTANVGYRNAGSIIVANATRNTILLNVAFADQMTQPSNGFGIFVGGGSTFNTLASNVSYGNPLQGISIAGSSYNILASNLAYKNAGYGIELNGATNNTLIANSLYANLSSGLYNDGGSTGNSCAACNIGYSGSSLASPDTTAEVGVQNTTTNNLILKNPW